MDYKLVIEMVLPFALSLLAFTWAMTLLNNKVTFKNALQYSLVFFGVSLFYFYYYHTERV